MSSPTSDALKDMARASATNDDFTGNNPTSGGGSSRNLQGGGDARKRSHQFAAMRRIALGLPSVANVSAGLASVKTNIGEGIASVGESARDGTKASFPFFSFSRIISFPCQCPLGDFWLLAFFGMNTSFRCLWAFWTASCLDASAWDVGTFRT